MYNSSKHVGLNRKYGVTTHMSTKLCGNNTYLYTPFSSPILIPLSHPSFSSPILIPIIFFISILHDHPQFLILPPPPPTTSLFPFCTIHFFPIPTPHCPPLSFILHHPYVISSPSMSMCYFFQIGQLVQ